MRTVSSAALLVLLAACSGGESGSENANTIEFESASTVEDLTTEEAAWCADNPFEHGEAARALGIPVVGDYVREFEETEGPDLSDWEPPILAVPADGREPLTYVIRFDNQEDSDRACRVAFEER